MLQQIIFSLLLILSFSTASYSTEYDGRGSTSLQTKRLVSSEDHIRFLKSALKTAQKSVMISSYDVAYSIFDEGIGGDIISAAKRGVNIYIYYENRCLYSNEEYKKFSTIIDHCAKFEANENHSKCVIKDKEEVAIGSYNWLSDRRENSANATIVVSGTIAAELSKDIWQGIRFYQSLKYENDSGMDKFLNNQEAFSTKAYQLAPRQSICSLSTPEAHGIFLDDIFAKAKERVVLFSPFIRLAKLKRIFTPKLLNNLRNRNVNCILVTLPSPYNRNLAEQREILSLLNSLSANYTSFSFVKQSNFHSKTLISDCDLICEGSFNWLSAVDDIEHCANNFEMSVALQGTIAKNMIQVFNTTELGELLSRKQINNTKETNLKRKAETGLTNKKSYEYPKKQKTLQVQIPKAFDNHIRIFSGEKFQLNGFCVKLEGDYLRDAQNKTAYFATQQEAKEEAYAVRTKEQRILPLQIPQNFDNHIKIFSGARFNINGYCVKLEGDYLVDAQDEISYFATQQEAKEEAYAVWKSS